MAREQLQRVALLARLGCLFEALTRWGDRRRKAGAKAKLGQSPPTNLIPAW